MRTPPPEPGTRFGLLITLKRYYESPDRGNRRITFWSCWCDCGSLAMVQERQLKSSQRRSCGCQRKVVIDPVDPQVIISKTRAKSARIERKP